MKPNFACEPMLINGKRTFASVLEEYWDEVSQYWNLDTQAAYSRDFEDLILPRFRKQPLECFDHVSQFDEVIEEIRQGGTRRYGKDSEYSSSTLRRFRFLMRRVVKIAAAHGICEDVLWGTIYVDEGSDDPDKAVVEEKIRLHKSLLPEEEYDLADEIFSDPLQVGEKMVALLGWAHGTRPQESAAVNWGHILPLSDHSDKYVLAVLTTVDGDGTKLGGKSKNMFRFMPISHKEYEFLMRRKQHIQEQIDSGVLVLDVENGIASIDHLPIACAGHDYAMRCSLRKASNVCKDILRSIGIKETLYRYLSQEAADSDEISVWGREKDVTLYLLRRNFGTHLHNLGFTMSKIQYLMGHKIDDPMVKRADFRNSDVMANLWNKLSLRPVLNDLPKWEDDEFVF